jgi:hypothetical protein
LLVPPIPDSRNQSIRLHTPITVTDTGEVLLE